MSKYLMAFSPDKQALADVGKQVRERLKADPSVYQVVEEKAEVYVAADFLDDFECSELMKLVDETARPSTLFEETFKEGYRTSYSGDLTPEASIAKMIDRRLSDLLGLDETWGERAQGQRYAPGQQYKEHWDWFDTNSSYWETEKKRGGQRAWTAMVYLNDVEKGGATEFRNLGIKIEPQKGAVLIWNNAHPDGTPNKNTIHAALPVEEGAKYVITKWFRTRAWV
ncbi:MAG: 2OG-Fe(II) oxygenase [Sphingomonadaceae bacterium]